jgi:hypothetical protein
MTECGWSSELQALAFWSGRFRDQCPHLAPWQTGRNLLQSAGESEKNLSFDPGPRLQCAEIAAPNAGTNSGACPGNLEGSRMPRGLRRRNLA